jgi:pimeloyl-ACP methyl ester carboxylesterase
VSATETVGDVEVRVTRTDGAPLMMLVRMASQGIGIWDGIWGDLARRFTVASFDLVGAARLEADLPPRERFRALAEVVVQVASGLGFERFHVFGWYGGAHVALAAMLDHRRRIVSCILLDPFFELDDMRKVEKGIAFKRAIFEADRSLYAYYWVMAGFSPGFMEENFDLVQRLAQARIERDRFMSQDSTRWLRWVRALRSNWLEPAELAAITTPTLILASELDGWHAGPTVGMARALCARLPAAEMLELKSLGTFCFIENPALFRQIAEPFLVSHASDP